MEERFGCSEKSQWNTWLDEATSLEVHVTSINWIVGLTTKNAHAVLTTGKFELQITEITTPVNVDRFLGRIL